MVYPGLQRTFSRAEKEGKGERRSTSEFFAGGRGHGHVRPVHKEYSDENSEHCLIIYYRFCTFFRVYLLLRFITNVLWDFLL